MKRQKGYLVMIISLTLLVLIGLIVKHQWHLTHAKSIFVELVPVDPRSILQGDYMALRYNLVLRAGGLGQFENSGHVLSYVQLDQQQRIRLTTLTPQAQAQPLWLKNPTNQVQDLYPAANSFLFAEGLADCYAQATHAELKVNAEGRAMLVNLTADDLQPLNCQA